jgi:hypothetical protein
MSMAETFKPTFGRLYRLIGGFTRAALSWRWINDHVCINARG